MPAALWNIAPPTPSVAEARHRIIGDFTGHVARGAEVFTDGSGGPKHQPDAVPRAGAGFATCLWDSPSTKGGGVAEFLSRVDRTKFTSTCRIIRVLLKKPDSSYRNLRARCIAVAIAEVPLAQTVPRAELWAATSARLALAEVSVPHWVIAVGRHPRVR